MRPKGKSKGTPKTETGSSLECSLCSGVHATVNCAVITNSTSVTDQQLPLKSIASLPSNILSIKNNSNTTLGVFAKKIITANTRFGPFDAPLFTSRKSGKFILKVLNSSNVWCYLDSTDRVKCNWMCYVQPATHTNHWNCTAFLLNGAVHYITNKTIYRGQQLRVWYSQAYAKLIGVHLKLLPSLANTHESIDGNALNKDQSDESEVTARVLTRKSTSCYANKDRSEDNTKDNFLPQPEDASIWSCSLCTELTSGTSCFARHLLTHYQPKGKRGRRPAHHQIEIESDFYCQICDKSFDSDTLVHKHRVNEHRLFLRSMRECGVTLADLSREKPISEQLIRVLSLINSCSVEARVVCMQQIKDLLQTAEADSLTTRNDQLEGIRSEYSDLKCSVRRARLSGSYECAICKKRFETELYLYRHLRNHTADFVCVKCHKTFGRNESLQKHTCDTIVVQLTCEFCGRQFDDRQIFLRHINRHKTDSEYVCVNCGDCFQTKITLLRHKCRVADGTQLKCMSCDKVFGDMICLERHLLIHTSEYACDLCGKTLGSYRTLISHKQICIQIKRLANQGSNDCTVCGAHFTEERSFRRHFLHHTHPYPCGICWARFRTQKQLNIHVCKIADSVDENEITVAENNAEILQVTEVVANNEDEPKAQLSKQECKVCGKQFDRGTVLVDHMSVHNASNVPCAVCGKLFKTQKSRNVHLRIHAGFKRFRCTVCGKKFSQKQQLQRHIKQHQMIVSPGFNGDFIENNAQLEDISEILDSDDSQLVDSNSGASDDQPSVIGASSDLNALEAPLSIPSQCTLIDMDALMSNECFVSAVSSGQIKINQGGDHVEISIIANQIDLELAQLLNLQVQPHSQYDLSRPHY